MAAIVLVSMYIAAQMIADVTAVKLVTLFGVVVPGGTLIYAVTFTLRDMLHKRLGKRAAQATIVMAAVVNILMALYFLLTINMPSPPFWGMQEAYESILGFVPYIVAASILAEVLSELVDTELYHIAARGFAKDRIWLRVVFSNLFSVPIDSIVFAYLAFSIFPGIFGGHAIDMAGIRQMVIGQTLFKWVVSMVVMPATYLTGSGEVPD